MTEKNSHNPIDHLRQLLDNGEYEKALWFVDHVGQDNSLMKNARGVCLMRQGNIEPAIKLLRDLNFAGQICIPSDTPPLYQANYATALLMKGYNQEAMEILAGLKARQHPYVAAMHETIAEWKRGLNLFQRLGCLLRLYPRKQVSLKYPPGSL
jgi:predicted Zn-dependent protease